MNDRERTEPKAPGNDAPATGVPATGAPAQTDTSASARPALVYCRCAYARVVPLKVKDAVLEALAASGVDFDAAPDLCEMSARRDPRLKEIASAGPVKIAACYPRAVRWLFNDAGSPLEKEQVTILNMREQTAEEVAAAMLNGDSKPAAEENRMSGAGALSLPVLQVALYEGRGAEPIDAGRRFALIGALLDRGYRVTRVTEGAAARADDGNALAVLGRFSDDQPADALGTDAGGRVWFRDIGDHTPDAVLAQVEAIRAECDAREPGNWKPWFPVIDFDRCTNCMQCLSFCLFDVYGVSKQGQIQVQNHDNCKTDCPACSRVCPEVAILFPKYRHGPIHGGEVNSDDVRREAMKVDISALLGGDIYAALRDRSAKAKSRFSKERDEERALKERQKCLVKLQANLDIPAEVLTSLPSLDEIQAKAEAAKRRAEEAVQANLAAGQAVGQAGGETAGPRQES